MLLYAFLLDLTSYGAYAATGGNLLAAAGAGAAVVVGSYGVQVAAEGAMRARLRAAGRTQAFFDM
jgi:hypothetical protein